MEIWWIKHKETTKKFKRHNLFLWRIVVKQFSKEVYNIQTSDLSSKHYYNIRRGKFRMSFKIWPSKAELGLISAICQCHWNGLFYLDPTENITNISMVLDASRRLGKQLLCNFMPIFFQQSLKQAHMSCS